ncbi:MAG: hypothetical protein LBU73_04785 [Helicobacteraceae bacterium]|jgi:hypothetical protein|nr:hypothetical protein [Helicobacteraceae bacterium]
MFEADREAKMLDQKNFAFYTQSVKKFFHLPIAIAILTLIISSFCALKIKTKGSYEQHEQKREYAEYILTQRELKKNVLSAIAGFLIESMIAVR